MCDSKWPTWQVLEIEKDDGKEEKDTEHPHPARERSPRRRRIPEIYVWCHLPWKTSQLPAEPEDGPEDEETQKFAYFACAT